MGSKLQSYLVTHLAVSNKVRKAAILDRKGGIWAISEGFQLSYEEQTAAIDAVQDIYQMAVSGLTLNGQEYGTAHVSDDILHMVKHGGGAILVKTEKSLVVAVYESPVQQVEASPIVEGMADYLLSIGY
ncbi:unnamed protein product [Penicillium viridicatum]